MAVNFDLSINQGTTFTVTFRWATAPVLYKPITGVATTTPLRLTVPAHGLPTTWPVAIVSTNGLDEVRAANNPPRTNEFFEATVIDADTLELNQVNAADYVPYISGGFVQTYTPVDLTGYTAAMQIREDFGGPLVLTLASPANITLDSSSSAVTVTIDAATTGSVLTQQGVYDLEVTSPTGVVSRLAYGSVTFPPEVTS